jgi:hypothetical protein
VLVVEVVVTPKPVLGLKCGWWLYSSSTLVYCCAVEVQADCDIPGTQSVGLVDLPSGGTSDGVPKFFESARP